MVIRNAWTIQGILTIMNEAVVMWRVVVLFLGTKNIRQTIHCFILSIPVFSCLAFNAPAGAMDGEEPIDNSPFSASKIVLSNSISSSQIYFSDYHGLTYVPVSYKGLAMSLEYSQEYIDYANKASLQAFKPYSIQPPFDRLKNKAGNELYVWQQKSQKERKEYKKAKKNCNQKKLTTEKSQESGQLSEKTLELTQASDNNQDAPSVAAVMDTKSKSKQAGNEAQAAFKVLKKARANFQSQHVTRQDLV